MAEHAYDVELAARRPEVSVRTLGTATPTLADRDGSTRYAQFDFGRLRVRVPTQARPQMADSDAQVSDAVFFMFPNGHVRLSVLAVPRGQRLWPERAEEIATAQTRAGDQVSSVWGQWGRELRITSGDELNCVIGVDGPCWMLLGRASWQADDDGELAETLRAMIRTSEVFRGEQPLPARAPLPLTRPGRTATEQDEQPGRNATYAAVVTLATSKTVDATATPAAVETRQPQRYPHDGGSNDLAPPPCATRPERRPYAELLAAAVLMLVAAVAVGVFAMRDTTPIGSSPLADTPVPAPALPNTERAPNAAAPHIAFPLPPSPPTAGSTAPTGSAPRSAPRRVPAPAAPNPAPTKPGPPTPVGDPHPAAHPDPGPHTASRDGAGDSTDTSESDDRSQGQHRPAQSNPLGALTNTIKKIVPGPRLTGGR